MHTRNMRRVNCKCYVATYTRSIFQSSKKHFVYLLLFLFCLRKKQVENCAKTLQKFSSIFLFSYLFKMIIIKCLKFTINTKFFLINYSFHKLTNRDFFSLNIILKRDRQFFSFFFFWSSLRGVQDVTENC